MSPRPSYIQCPIRTCEGGTVTPISQMSDWEDTLQNGTECPLACTTTVLGSYLHWLQVSAVHYDDHKHTDRYSQSLLEGERNYGWTVWTCVYVGCAYMCGVQTLLFIAIISLFSFLSIHRHHFNNYWYYHASQMWNFYSHFSLKASICLNSVHN